VDKKFWAYFDAGEGVLKKILPIDGAITEKISLL